MLICVMLRAFTALRKQRDDRVDSNLRADHLDDAMPELR